MHTANPENREGCPLAPPSPDLKAFRCKQPVVRHDHAHLIFLSSTRDARLPAPDFLQITLALAQIPQISSGNPTLKKCLLSRFYEVLT
jgi:glycerophosphoryl diester phosphodiesterase